VNEPRLGIAVTGGSKRRPEHLDYGFTTNGVLFEGPNRPALVNNLLKNLSRINHSHHPKH
jgi:hypothetical protein